jgi:hypothetical protein
MASGEVSLIGAGVSVLLPFILGVAALTAIAPPRFLSKSERLGLAYPLGAVLITSPICALGYAGLHFDRITFALIPVILTLLFAAVAVWRRRAASHQPRATPWAQAAYSSPAQAGIPSLGWVWPAALSAVALCMLAFVIFEVLDRPLSPADSFTVWGLRAKVWATRGGLVLNPFDPFYLGRPARANYPPHISLLQTWTAVWLGGWNEVLVNLPWACYYASALLFVFAALSRPLPRSWALCGTGLVATTPLFVIHAAVAGYADLISGVNFAVAAVAVYLWASEGAMVHLVIATLFGLSLLFIKREGLVLLAACAAAAAVQVGWPRRRGYRWELLAGVSAVALFFAWRNPTLRGLLASAGWHGQAVIPLLQSLAEFGSFQFLWPLFFVTGFITLGRSWKSPLAWLFATVSAPLLPFCAVFLGTDAARFAVNQGAPSRLFLQLAPAAVCFVMLAAGELAKSKVQNPKFEVRHSKFGLSLVLVLVLVLVVVVALSARSPSGLHWDLPSSDWRVEMEPTRGMLRYAGPPIDVDGSTGLAVTAAPGLDAGRMAIDWRRSADPDDNRVMAHLRRLHPFVFVDLSAQSAWAGRLATLTITVPPELADAVVAVDIPQRGLSTRLWTAWQSFWTPAILDPRTMNVFEGAQVAGLPLAPVAGGLWGLVVVAAAFATWVRTRRCQGPLRSLTQEGSGKVSPLLTGTVDLLQRAPFETPPEEGGSSGRADNFPLESIPIPLGLRRPHLSRGRLEARPLSLSTLPAKEGSGEVSAARSTPPSPQKQGESTTSARVARSAILCALALWTLCSARFAWDLLATFRVDQQRFASPAAAARFDTLNAEFNALVAAAQRVIPPDAPITFVSQFPLYSDRAQYAFYPRPVVNWILPLPVPPQYAVLFRPSPGSFDPRRLRILAAPSKTSAVAQPLPPQERESRGPEE